MANRQENYYLDLFKSFKIPMYNCMFPPFNRGGQIHSLSSREKISAAQKGRVITWGEKISEALTGHLVSGKTRKRISKALLGRRLSKSHRLKIEVNQNGLFRVCIALWDSLS
jgi:hypothetical protein